MITAPAYAKINLTLEVLGKRPDGFHNIRSVIQTVSLSDTIVFKTNPNTVYKSDLSGWSAQKSLIKKAVELLGTVASDKKGISIEVIKRIPLVSGLGGDSSDTAVTLQTLNDLWGLNLSFDLLRHIAAQLGSDVTFFLYGGTALMEGRGEQITPLPAPVKTWIVLVIPQITRLPQKTTRLYGALQQNHYTDGKITERQVVSLKEGRKITPELLFNTFENVAFELSPELNVCRQHILKTGAGNLHLAGSGPAMFSIVRDEAEGRDLCQQLQSPGLATYLTHTLNSDNNSV